MTFDLGKFQRLRRQRDERRAALRDASTTLYEARTEMQRLEGFAREQEEAHRVGSWRTVRRVPLITGGAVEHQERVTGPSPALLSDLEFARARFAEARAHVESLQRDVDPLNQLVARLEAFLLEHKITPETIAVRATPPHRPAGFAPRVEDIAAIREQIRDAHAERAQIAEAPIAEREAFERVDAWLSEASTRLQIAAQAFIKAERAGYGFALFSRDDFPVSRAEDKRVIEALFATTNTATLRKLLRGAAEEAAREAGGWGLPAREREARLRALDAEIYQLEIGEERGIEALEASGLTVARRPEADPRAVLSPELAEPAPLVA